MREAQKAAEKSKSMTAITKCRRLENEIDAEISRVQAILDSQQPKQTSIFND